MNLKWIIHNKIIKSGPFIILVSVLLGIYQIKMFKQYNHVDINLAHYIIYSFGYIENTLDLINVSLWIFPIIFLIYLLGNTVNDFFKKQAVYIFTRTEKRSIWYIKESIHLLLNVILFYIIYFSGNLANRNHGPTSHFYKNGYFNDYSRFIHPYFWQLHFAFIH